MRQRDGELGFGVLLVILPSVDRNPNHYWRRRPVALIVALAVVLTMVTLTVVMAATPVEQHLGT